MTLILTVNGKNSVWMLSDRRLSFGNRPPKDDACKVMFLEAKDSKAILGYAGLGQSIAGMEPSIWMSNVLRGIDAPLEHTLEILARAIKDQLPKHLASFPKGITPHHAIYITSFVDEKPMAYIFEVALSPNRFEVKILNSRYFRDKIGGSPPKFFLGGSGAQYLLSNRKKWQRPLLHLISAYDAGKVSPSKVSDYLAKLNNDTFEYYKTKDKFVGPRCIVAWRNNYGGFYNGGGGQEFYTNCKKDINGCQIPTIVGGIDLNAVFNVTRPHTIRQFINLQNGIEEDQQYVTDQINAELALLPDSPNTHFP